MGFAQVWLEVVAININNIGAFVRAGQTSLNISLNIYLYQKPSSGYGRTGILMPHLRKALSLPVMPLDSHHTQTNAVDIYTLLDHLKIRKAMYLGNEYNFNSLDSFISGFTMAASDGQLELNEYPNFRYFSTWLLGHLKTHFGLAGGWHWQIKNRNPNDDTKAFEEFFEFLEVFKMSKVASKSIIVDKDAIEFSKSSGVTRFNIVDGESIPFEDRPNKILWMDITHHSLPLISEDSLPVFQSKVYQQVMFWEYYFRAKFTTC